MVPARPYLFLLVEGQAGSPARSPDICSCHLEDIHIERLLEKNDVVLGDPKAVVIAWGEERAGGNGAEHLCALQGALSLHPVLWRKARLRHSAGPPPDHGSPRPCQHCLQLSLLN